MARPIRPGDSLLGAGGFVGVRWLSGGPGIRFVRAGLRGRCRIRDGVRIVSFIRTPRGVACAGCSPIQPGDCVYALAEGLLGFGGYPAAPAFASLVPG